jgi:aldose 1-epimerase
MNIYSRPWGTLSNGETAALYTLVNDSGLTVEITDFGGTIVSLKAPDRSGKLTDVVLGYDSLADYEHADGYLGALVGRVANRIAGASFELDGETYTLYVNDGSNSLHGGKRSMSYVVWNAECGVTDTSAVLTLTYFSPDGDEGYPGNLTAKVTYTLDNENALSIRYEAVTDKATPLNLTNHAYFNLAGTASGTVFGQELWLDAESYLAGDKDLIPLAVKPVDGTPFDFRTSKPIGRDFFADFADLRIAGGYDHCFNFTDWKTCTSGGDVTLRGVAFDPVSGRKMEMYTNQPCVQLYTANFLKNPCFPLRGGYAQRTQTAFCLETQMMPDSIHHQNDPDFTDCVLRPGETYDYTTVYKFTAE